jgi:hypothetical protein
MYSDISTNRRQTCKGNDIECCDGADQLNVFNTRAVPAGWTLLGCYVDSVGARTLPSQLFPPGNLTADSCTAACLGARYIYAGTEYGGECVSLCSFHLNVIVIDSVDSTVVTLWQMVVD